MSSDQLPTTIAIDGPAASGKSTVARRLAAHLGYLYVDTGVMYRAVTLAALWRGLDIASEDDITRLAETLPIDVQPPRVADGRQYTVVADGQDVTREIRRQEVDANVSPVSAYPGVRAALTAQQRRVAARGRVVMVGRDIGTVVLPEADLKIYLDASVETRARRRYEECRSRGEDVSYEDVLAAMRKRDQIDTNRAVAPLRAAPDAIRLDTTDLTLQQVFEHLLSLLGTTLEGSHA